MNNIHVLSKFNEEQDEKDGKYTSIKIRNKQFKNALNYRSQMSCTM